MNFSHAFRITHFSKEKLFLVNGVDITPSGNIVVTDGGNNAIRIYNPDGEPLYSIGREGFGRDRFKEPVGAFSMPDGRILVADWHNHRIVLLTETLEYIGEFGHLGSLNELRSFWKRAAHFLLQVRALASSGSYLYRHFENGKTVAHASSSRRRKSLTLWIQGIRYLIRRHGSPAKAFSYMTSRRFAINKPNGAALLSSGIAISQKDNRCISIHEDHPPYATVKLWDGPKNGVRFGRLGNICNAPNGDILVCDEPAGAIWRLSSDGQLRDAYRGHDSGIGSFAPFSCRLSPDGLLFVCGGTNFQVIDTATKEVVFVSGTIGELHGIALNQACTRIMLADRLEGCIHVYDFCRD